MLGSWFINWFFFFIINVKKWGLQWVLDVDILTQYYIRFDILLNMLDVSLIKILKYIYNLIVILKYFLITSSNIKSNIYLNLMLGSVKWTSKNLLSKP